MGNRQRLGNVGSFVDELDKELERFTCKICKKIYGVPTMARDCEEDHNE